MNAQTHDYITSAIDTYAKQNPEICSVLTCTADYVCGNFDMILNHFSRGYQIHTTLHTPCAVLCLVVIMLTGC